MRTKHQTLSRVNVILEIAQRMAKKQDKEHNTYVVSSRIDEIHIHIDGYAEPGYSDVDIVATGNWNAPSVYNARTKSREVVSNLPEHICKLFEKLGVEIEWSDEWTTCDDCSKLIRTSPDCWDWKPYYNKAGIERGECVCLDCCPEEEETEEESSSYLHCDDVEDFCRGT